MPRPWEIPAIVKDGSMVLISESAQVLHAVEVQPGSSVPSCPATSLITSQE